jgi:iron-sulfur cluster assembly accessory protein
MKLNITLAASNKIVSFIEQVEGMNEPYLRVAVQPGGCSGLRYQLYFDDKVDPRDYIEVIDKVSIRIDPMSTPYLDGASIDFVDTIEKQGFTIDNPNAQGGCSCGDSFN